MFNVTIVFWGLVALAFPSPTDHSEARAIWLHASGHDAWIWVDDPGFEHNTSSHEDKTETQNGVTWYLWKLTNEVVSLDTTENSIQVVGDLEDKLLDPQRASLSPPNMATQPNKGWDAKPAFRVTGGTFSYDAADIIQSALPGVPQLFAYRAVFPGKRFPHQAVKTFRYSTTSASTLTFGAKKIILKSGAGIRFVNAGGLPGPSVNQHYVGYWNDLFPPNTTQYLPMETLPYPENLAELKADHQHEKQNKKDTKKKPKKASPSFGPLYYPKAPERCPPPIVHRSAS